jgi:capsular polysaccharide biosynthesis protein
LSHRIFKNIPYKEISFEEYFKTPDARGEMLGCKLGGAGKIAKIKQGRLFGYNGYVISPDNLLIQPPDNDKHTKPYKIPLNTLFLLPKEIELEGNAISLAGYFHDTYYHWTIEVFPQIKCFIENLEIDHYIVPRPKEPFQKEMLKMLGLNEAKIKYIDDNTLYRAQQLYVCACRKMSCRLSFYKENFRPKNPKNIEKLYVSRKKAKLRQILNENEVFEILQKHGFETVYFEELTLQEQIDTVANARYIIAPHGAGLTNMVFASELRGLIEIFEKTNTNLCYVEFADHLNYKHTRLEAKSHNKDIIVDPNTLEQAITDLLTY